MTRATALLPSGRRRGELHWELALALRVAGAAEESADALRRAEADARAHDDRALRARVSAEAAWVKLGAGQMPLDEAAAEIAAAAAQLEQAGDERGLGRALLAAAAVHMFGCNYTELEARRGRSGCALRTCRGLTRRMRRRAGGGDLSRPDAGAGGEAPLRCAARTCTRPHDRGDRLGRARRAARPRGRRREREVAHRRGAGALRRRRHPLRRHDDAGAAPARSRGVRGRPGARRGSRAGEPRTARGRGRGEPRLQHQPCYRAGRATTRPGQDGRGGAARRLRAANAVGSDVYAQFMWRSVRGRILASKGELEEAETLARDATAISSHTDGLHNRARSHLALAEVLRRAGRADAEREELDEALRLLEAKEATALVASLRTASYIS